MMGVRLPHLILPASLRLRFLMACHGQYESGSKLIAAGMYSGQSLVTTAMLVLAELVM
jgi:hypothetical protein